MLNEWMYQQFQTWGPQDYKNQPWGGSAYVGFGNFNYGAVCGGVGFSLTYCQSAAGIGLIGRVSSLNYLAGIENAANAGTGVVNPGATNNGQGIPFVSPPYGDQAGDSATIAQGYAYQAQGCSD